MNLKSAVLIFLISFSFLNSKAQLTADFPDSNFSWNESMWTRGCDDTCPFNYVYGTTFDSTSHILNNYTYRSLYANLTSYSLLTHLSPPVIKNIRNYTKQIGYIRNDKLNKKVYFRYSLSDTDSDYLLYDFDLKLFEPYPQTLQNNFNQKFVVYKIDSTIDKYGVSRRLFYLGDSSQTDYTSGGVIVEGIGTTKPLFSNNLTLTGMSWSFSSELDCIKIQNKSYSFSLGSTSLILDSIANCKMHYFMYTSVESEIAKNIKIIPNPCINYISINLENKSASIYIINSLGQCTQLNGAYENDSWSFDISEFPTGIYSIKVVSDKEIYYSKVSKL